MKNNIANNHLANLRQLGNNLKSLKIADDTKVLLSYTYRITTKKLISIYENMASLYPKEHQSYWSHLESNYSHITIGINKCYYIDKTSDINTISDKIDKLFRDSCHMGELPPKIVGGIKFNPDQNQYDNSIWINQPAGIFIIPKIIITETKIGQYATVICFTNNNDEIDDIIDKLSSKIDTITKISEMESNKTKNNLNTIKKSECVPKKSEFISSVINAISQIKQKKLKKIVLSYMNVISFEESFDATALIKKMKGENCTNYHFQMPDNSSIFGTSPEKLFNKHNLEVKTEALAGSSISKDNLLSSNKDLHEHQIVVDYITKSLEPICKEITFDKVPNIKSHSKLFHLSTEISANLRTDINPLSLINAIHPTPAVCGVPTPRAIQEIDKLERSDRGWYTGIIGWMDSAMNADFVVNLRSGFYSNNYLYLFGGAGIVEGSDPILEWEEINNKISTIKELLG